MKESDLESVLAKHPDLIEAGLILTGRQVTVYGRRMDLLFDDKHKRKLIVELKAGPIKDEHIGQILSYEGMLLSADNPDIRVMLVGTRVPPNIQKTLDHHGIAWKEIKLTSLKEFLANKGDNQFDNLFEDGIYPSIKMTKNETNNNASIDNTKRGLSSESSAFKLFKDQQELFSKALREYDPSIWFPSLRGNFEEQVRGNWFICFIPGAWGRWKPQRYGVHFDFICAPAKKDLPERFRLAIGVESPLIEQQRQVFKEDVIAQVRAKGIVQSGFVLQSEPRKKLLEADPIPFDNQSWKVAIEKYIALEAVVSVIAQLVRDFHKRGAFDEAMEF